MAAYVFTLTNAKGGCGKTTVVLNLAIFFSRAGYRTLAIDLSAVPFVVLLLGNPKLNHEGGVLLPIMRKRSFLDRRRGEISCFDGFCQD
jgi:cellulose biosynthesis protein BcsQ